MIEARDALTQKDAEASEPLRRLCIVTRRELPQDRLIRFVLAPDGSVVPDLARKLPGRGVWVTAARDVVDRAAKANAFSKGFKKKANVPNDLGGQVATLLARRLRDALSIANKAGSVVTGFSKVEAMLGGTSVIALIHASEAAEDGVKKLDRKFLAATGRKQQDLRIINDLKGTDLDLAMGRPNVVHAALTESGAARNFLSEARRYRRYRLNEDCETVGADAPREGISTGTE